MALVATPATRRACTFFAPPSLNIAAVNRNSRRLGARRGPCAMRSFVLREIQKDSPRPVRALLDVQIVAAGTSRLHRLQLGWRKPNVILINEYGFIRES